MASCSTTSASTRTCWPTVCPPSGCRESCTAQRQRSFGLEAGTPVAYRGGDQPNNALSLNVLNPGEIAATAGTSGVVYGVTDRKHSIRSRASTPSPRQPHRPIRASACCSASTAPASERLDQAAAGRCLYEEMDGLADGSRSAPTG